MRQLSREAKRLSLRAAGDVEFPEQDTDFHRISSRIKPSGLPCTIQIAHFLSAKEGIGC
jgi:uncharacterized protein YozE (UPF0346 family)